MVFVWKSNLVLLCIMKPKGFTLIELLVVIAIIGILAVVIISSLNRARVKSYDARIIQTVSNLKTALEMYHLDNGKYPTSYNGGNWNGFCAEGVEMADWAQSYMSPDFQDQIRPYMPGVLQVLECDDILYYSNPVSGYYLNACNINQISNQNGYVLVYATSDAIQEEFLFYDEGEGGSKWHCRSHAR